MTLPSVLGCQVCSALEKQNVPLSKVFFGAKCASALAGRRENSCQSFFFALSLGKERSGSSFNHLSTS